MLSLIVAPASPTPTAGEYRFALSNDATPGLPRADAGVGADSPLLDHGSAPMALLPRADEVVMVVPTRMLSWHRIVLPKVNSARLRNALEGILEERLLDEPQNLHFALAPGAASSTSVWVAACNKAWLQAALQAFESAGRPVARVVPEYAPLPAGNSPTLHIIGSLESAWLVRCADDGVQLLPLVPAVRGALGLGNQASLEGAANPVFSDPAVAALAEQLLGVKVKVQHSAQGLVAAARSHWDLAQFDLASTGSIRLARRAAQAWAQWADSAAWRPARWGLVTLIGVNLLGLNAWAWMERSALESKRMEVRGLLTQTFPKVPVVDAPVQMEHEVAVLRRVTGAVSSRDMEPMLASIAENIQTDRPPSAIEFTANELTLKGFQAVPAEASALTKGLAAAGYSSRVDGETWVVRADAKAAAGAKP